MTKKEKVVYGSIFVTSLLYAPLLSWWKRKDPISFADYTWFQVVIGVGYVLIGLRFLLTSKTWDRVFLAFFVSCIPIIGRSILQSIGRNRDYYQFNGNRK